jgi:hypothetical protein
MHKAILLPAPEQGSTQPAAGPSSRYVAAAFGCTVLSLASACLLYVLLSTVPDDSSRAVAVIVFAGPGLGLLAVSPGIVFASIARRRAPSKTRIRAAATAALIVNLVLFLPAAGLGLFMLLAGLAVSS